MWSADRARRAGIVTALVTLIVLGACGSDEPPPPAVAPSPSPTPDPTCPLSGLEPPAGVDLERPALAVKVENYPPAYPLSGLEDAELVYEELVEGGITRFMAIYHCTDSEKVGPIRSVRIVDIGIMTPMTRLVAAAGGNEHVRRAVSGAGLQIIDEPESTPHAMQRIPNGLSKEHTLFGMTDPLRAMGSPDAPPPPSDLYTFGDPEKKGRRATSVDLVFGPQTQVTYEWEYGAWTRYQAGVAFVDEGGASIPIDNVVIEEHVVNNSRELFDVAGNPSTEVADEIGSGRLLLFRDGRVIRGRWARDALTDPVRYETRSGEPLPLKPGRTWVALLPSATGELQGSFTIN